VVGVHPVSTSYPLVFGRVLWCMSGVRRCTPGITSVSIYGHWVDNVRTLDTPRYCKCVMSLPLVYRWCTYGVRPASRQCLGRTLADTNLQLVGHIHKAIKVHTRRKI
jgi:hypothetical protein